ncbi:hypothetical protein DN069_08680 [Streptacidiphilus pinicola]|uniref:Uncharacterized protein n=1 Tax=Streptacidiphilus pinicola TaxID=2219663 RepID=A0A2X0KA10_9ACTN|nr:hypothetical protein [Streptacidiphilus pinicola]RAG86075.1 hypothetical protein DN069_08680 [Streptacidiphilus pinicola]
MNDTGLGEPSALDLEFRGLPLLDSPWSVRFARGTRDRRALEVYNNGLLLDVMVETALATQLLRGARRGCRDGRHSVLAWGHVCADGTAPSLTLGRAGTPLLGAITTPGGFWLALTDGDADRVLAHAPDGTHAKLRVRAGWSR